MEPTSNIREDHSLPSGQKRGKTHVLKVWGDFACFTRPEMKVERYSYPIITPSAARGIFDAIYFKKEAGFYWQIETIEMLKMPKYIALRRNEVKGKLSLNSSWITGKTAPQPLFADATDANGRTQRQTMALKNVCYHLHAHMAFRTSSVANPQAVDEQFIRRASNGKCFYQPYLGCREFPAWFELLESSHHQKAPAELDLDLGWMLYDVFDLKQSNNTDAPARISLFHAVLSQGTLKVPEYGSALVRKEGDAHAQ